MHAILEALRNNASKLHEGLPHHLVTTVAVRSPDQVASEADRQQLWSLLGVDSAMLEKVQVLDPWYEDEQLFVNPPVSGEAELPDLEDVSASVMYLFRWRCFTESRFLSMHEAATGLLGSMCCGLAQVVTRVSATAAGTASLQGFQKLSPDNLKCFVVLTIVGPAMSELQTALMTDDRLLRRHSELHLVLEEEMQAAHDLPNLVWQRLASLVGGECQPTTLRSECLNALHVALAYVHDKVFRPLSEWPWKLLLGDLNANLTELAGLDTAPAEPFAQKLWLLLKAGHSRAPLLEVLQLAQDVPFSTINVEQAHGSSATIQRFHPTLDMDVHMQRAYLHQCRRLFLPSQEERRQQLAAAKLERLRSHRKRSLSGRHVFFKNLTEVAGQVHGPGKLSKEARQELMVQHTKLYNLLQPSEKRHLQEQARLLSAQRQEARLDQVVETMSAQGLCKVRSEQERLAMGLTNFSSHCKYNADTLRRLQQLEADACRWTVKHLKDLREVAQRAPTQPPGEVQETLSHLEPTLMKPAKSEPDFWVKVLCEHRDDLQGLILGASFESGEMVYRFLFASQNPRRAVFQVLQCLDWDAGAAPQFGEGSILDYVDRCKQKLFHICPSMYCSHQDIVVPDELELLAMPSSRLVDSDLVEGLGLERPILEVLAPYPHRHRHRSAGTDDRPAPRPVRGQASAAEVQEHPWLQEYLAGASSSRQHHGERVSSAAATHSVPIDVPPLTEEQMASVWEELAEIRAAWHEGGAAPGADFQTSLRGGVWTKRQKDVVADAVAAAATSPDARNWLLRLDGQRMASFSILKFGDHAANLMATEWCKRRQFYYNLWLEKGAPEVISFSPDEVSSYAPSQEWADWISALPESDVASARARALNSYAPGQ